MARRPDLSFWRGRRVLVTGHTGFKGAWLTLWLDALGARVTGFSGPPPTDPSLFALADVGSACDDRRGDVCSLADVSAAVAAARPEIVFHLAAQAIVRVALEDPAGTYETNVIGTEHVLDAARDAAIVCVTSDKCYVPGEAAHREGDRLGGRDPYSASKAAQELVAAARRADGVRVATARAGNVIGGGDWGRDRLVPDLVRARDFGVPVVLRHPEAVRPWQHVLDALAGYLLLAERLHASSEWAEPWNFGPDGVETVGWVVERVSARWGLAVEVVPPADAVEAPALRLDSTKARSRLGWEPRLDLAAALDATVSWHDEVRNGAAARAVTLSEIEAAS
jgi:CDP-glucose 4,6-dehydratase